MLLAYHPEAVDALRQPSEAAPWKVLVSGCLMGWSCGVDGTDYGLAGALEGLLTLPSVHPVPLCPEQSALGTPRSTPDLHGGDGVDVLRGAARVLDEAGVDLTAQLTLGAEQMRDLAIAERVDLAILTDMSGACGSQVISDGCRLAQERRFQKGVGVATALLLAAGVPVVSQRDYLTLARLRARLDPSYTPPAGLVDHHDAPWTRAHLPGQHPRA